MSVLSCYVCVCVCIYSVSHGFRGKQTGNKREMIPRDEKKRRRRGGGSGRPRFGERELWRAGSERVI